MRIIARREAVVRGLRRAGVARRWWLLFSVGLALGLVGSSTAAAAGSGGPTSGR